MRFELVGAGIGGLHDAEPDHTRDYTAQRRKCEEEWFRVASSAHQPSPPRALLPQQRHNPLSSSLSLSFSSLESGRVGIDPSSSLVLLVTQESGSSVLPHRLNLYYDRPIKIGPNPAQALIARNLFKIGANK